MAAAQRKDDEQAKLWNSSAGCAWVEAQALLDRTLQPFEDLLVEAVAAPVARGACWMSVAALAARREELPGCSTRTAIASVSISRSR
jgi:hypothetical protein